MGRKNDRMGTSSAVDSSQAASVSLVGGVCVVLMSLSAWKLLVLALATSVSPVMPNLAFFVGRVEVDGEADPSKARFHPRWSVGSQVIVAVCEQVAG